MPATNLVTCDLLLVYFFTLVVLYFIFKFLNFVRKTVSCLCREYRSVKRLVREISDELHTMNHTLVLMHKDGSRSLKELNTSLNQFQTGATKYNVISLVLQLVQSFATAFATPSCQSTTHTTVNKYFDDDDTPSHESVSTSHEPVSASHEHVSTSHEPAYASHETMPTDSHNDGFAGVLNLLSTLAASGLCKQSAPATFVFDKGIRGLFPIPEVPETHKVHQPRPQTQPEQANWENTDSESEDECVEDVNQNETL